MSVTIKDVAKQANVSISTVSRVINDSKPVSDEIKKRVLEVIRETGYTPNPVARSLVMKKSHTIGVIVPDIASSYVGEVLNAMEEIAKAYAYEIILCNSYGELEQELKYLNLLNSKQVEGIIFITYRLKQEHKDFIDMNKMPVVMVNRKMQEDDNMYSVTVDHFDAAYQMTKYLLEQGHKKIALIRSGTTKETFGIDQLGGYQKALEESGISVNEDFVFDGNFKAPKAYEAVQSMIDSGNLPTVIFATADDMAIGAMNALYDNGFKIPEDVSVVGFYDTKMSNLYRPKLTTIRQPIYDMGAVAIRLLIKLIKGEEVADNMILLPHELIVRDSCRKIDA